METPWDCSAPAVNGVRTGNIWVGFGKGLIGMAKVKKKKRERKRINKVLEGLFSLVLQGTS